MFSRTCEIHPTSAVSESAKIGQKVRVGPYVVIGDEVDIGSGTCVGPHSVIQGPTSIGRHNRIFGQSAIGNDPQDLKYRGERTFLFIGDRNLIREFVTIHRGTSNGGGKTIVGNDNLLMSGAHIAHDSRVGDGVIIGNAATSAGHVEIGDHARVGAYAAIHQFCRVGPYAFVGAFSVLTRDALPFTITVGQRNQAKTYGINRVGLEREGFSPQRIEALRTAYRYLFQKRLKIKEAIQKIRQEGLETRDVAQLTRFIEVSQRGFVR